jgi:hypothetical protein
MEMICHVDVKSSPIKVRFFNNRLEMFIFLNGGEMKDYDVFDCSYVFIGGVYGNGIKELSSLLEETPAA